MPVLSTVWLGLLSEAVGAVAVVMLLGISQRYRGHLIQFRRARLEGWTALGAFAGLLALAFALFPSQGLESWVPVRLADLWPRLTLAVVELVVVLLVIRLRRQPLRSVLLGRQNLTPGLQMGLALVFLSLFLRGKIKLLFGGLEADVIKALFVWLGIALGQELLLRGFLQPRLSAWLGVTRGWLLAALLNVLWLLPIWLPSADPARLALFAALAFAQALLLGWISRRSGHVLAGVLFYALSSWLWMVV